MNLLGNFLYILHLMVAFIAIFLFWQVARWLVLPHLQIFPRIPPNPLWEGAYSALVAAAMAKVPAGKVTGKVIWYAPWPKVNW